MTNGLGAPLNISPRVTTYPEPSKRKRDSLMRGEPETLFWKVDAHPARQAHIADVVSRAERLSEAELLSGDPDHLVNHVIGGDLIRVPTLQRDAITYERSEQVSRRTGPFGEIANVKEPVFQFEVPFTGDPNFFLIRPNTYDSAPPRGQISGGRLILTVRGTTEPDAVQREVNAQLDSVEKYLRWHSDFWAGTDDEVRNAVRTRVGALRAKAEHMKSTDTGLAQFGFRPKS